jgi:uncharacterized protein (DUF1697 family)
MLLAGDVNIRPFRMPRLIAFLRAINVGGHTVTMAQLRKEFEALGLKNVETFIASGNVIFTWRSTDLPALEKKIEARLRASLGYEVATFVRTDAEVARIAAYKAFTDAQVKSAGAFCVGFLERPLDGAAARALMAFKTEIDDFHTNGREVYWLCRKGQGESTFSNANMERKLKVRATFRGINTVARLAAKYGAS